MQTLLLGTCWAIELKPHSLQSTLRLRRLDLHQVQRRLTDSMLTGPLLYMCCTGDWGVQHRGAWCRGRPELATLPEELAQ